MDVKTKVQEVLAPLVEKDGAELYLVRVEGSEVVIHFGGSYAGCPGVAAVARSVVAPVLKGVVPDVVVTAHSGKPVPRTAERIAPKG
jgi:Fe-S cluster biogenesis protein NfuA